MKTAEQLCWILLALLHLPPALAFARPTLITRLYAVAPGRTDFLLLVHRAALFAAVVALCLFAAFDPAARRVACVATAISMLSFLWLYVSARRPEALRQIAIADLVGLLPLGFVAWAAYSN